MVRNRKISVALLLTCFMLLTSLTTVQMQPISAQVAPERAQYTVVKGDTLYAISQEYGITISELQWANSLNSDLLNVGQKLVIPTRETRPLKDILAERGIPEANANLRIVVDKSDHVLALFSNDSLLKTYHVELGDNGLEDKAVAGDHKTPEGTFYISEKLVLNPVDEFLGSRWMRLSYPNIEDADRGLRDGLIDQQTREDIVAAFNQGKTTPQRTALGGGVGIHGGDTPQMGSDWTWGCVALTDADVEEFYDYVHVGTQVIIQR